MGEAGSGDPWIFSDRIGYIKTIGSNGAADSTKEIAMQSIRNQWYRLTRFMVVVYWDHEWSRTHYAKTYAEAMELAACYPKGTAVAIGKRGKVLAARWA